MLIKNAQILSRKVLMILLLIVAIPIISIFLPTNHVQAAADENQYKGVDISNWQGDVDISKIKNAGYSFVISKITEGTTYVDKYGRQNIDNTKKSGLIAGAYHFARFQNKDQAIEEADFFKQNCPSNVDFVVLDFEQQCSGDMTDACLAFLDSISSIAPAVIYCNPSWIDEHLNSNITKYPLWIANYGVSTPKTPIWGTYAIWQYSDNGQVDGIDGATDVDISGPEFDSILKHQPKVNYEPKIDLKVTSSNGNVDVKGWALNISGMKDVEIYVDGKYEGATSCNLATSDLKNQYSQYPNAANSGYDYRLYLNNGTHSIEVCGVGNDGNKICKKESINVNADTSIKIIDEKTNVDVNKTWTIKFNSRVDESTVNSKTIQVYDGNNNIINVSVKYKADSNEVIINPPSSGYESGKRYTIKVTNGVKSIKGKALSAVTVMDFTTK